MGINVASWSEDWYICILIEKIVHIVTPNLLFADNTADPYIRNSILLLPPHKRLEHAEELVEESSIYTDCILPETYRKALWSPAGLSPTGGCLLTVITTKHRVQFYSEPTSVQNNAEWPLLIDITDHLLDEYLGGKAQFETPEEFDRFRIFSGAWSQKIVPHMSAEAAAVLALGNQHGEINLWRYSPRSGIAPLSKIQSHATTVACLEWSKWRILDGKHVAYIFSGSVDGTVSVTKVVLGVGNDEDNSTRLQTASMEVVGTWFKDHKTMVNVISVHDQNGEGAIKAAVGKGSHVEIGILHHQAQSPEIIWSPCDLQNSAVGLSAATWDATGNYVHLYSFEGEATVFQVNEQGIQHSENKTQKLTEKLLAIYSREVEADADEDEVDNVLASFDFEPQIFGASSSFNGLYTAVYFNLRPVADIFHRPENFDVSWLSIILHLPRGDAEVVKEVNNRFIDYAHDPEFSCKYPVKSILLESLDYLINSANVDILTAWMDNMEKVLDTPNSFDDTRGSLASLIYSNSQCIAAQFLYRASIELRRAGLKSPYLEKMEALQKKAHTFLQSHLPRSVLEYISSLPSSSIEKFTDEDIVQTQLMVDRAVQHADKYAQNLETAEKACSHIKSSLPDNEAIDQTLSDLKSKEILSKDAGKEQCPACRELLVAKGDKWLVCSNQHIWEHCIVSIRALTTTKFRRCSLCGAKSMIPQHRQDTSLTETILSNCFKCVLCGSAW
ncbi:hypothetical protein VTP01DRAFT_3681 [Rhizomucor pusillus]|uniref:uncharacterized protein n=1 Tax=Rhizomucor pusillus TaxID=4840 RepID=UPI003742FB20